MAFGSHHVLTHINTNPKTPVVCPMPPHDTSFTLSHPLHKYHLIILHSSSPPSTCFIFLPLFTFHLSKHHHFPSKQTWALKDQTSSHKPQCSSKSSRDVLAWERKMDTTKMVFHSMSQKGILQFTLVKTEQGTLFQSPSLLILNSNACFAELKKNLGSITTWVLPSLVKK